MKNEKDNPNKAQHNHKILPESFFNRTLCHGRSAWKRASTRNHFSKRQTHLRIRILGAWKEKGIKADPRRSATTRTIATKTRISRNPISRKRVNKLEKPER
jgi:hypothetical protein